MDSTFYRWLQSDLSHPQKAPLSLSQHVAWFEQSLIERALKQESYNVCKAARVLGSKRSTLQSKLKSLGIKSDLPLSSTAIAKLIKNWTSMSHKAWQYVDASNTECRKTVDFDSTLFGTRNTS